MSLIDVYDGAFLHPLSAVPASVKAIAGYVGGPGAYHVWPVADAATVRASGREFWSIWVPPQRALSAADGTQAAQGMIRVLPGYNHPNHCPVFLNIEYGTWDASRTGADAASQAFVTAMHAAGYPRAYAYVPLAAGYGWGARYTYERPGGLPAGVVGIQYENDRDTHPGWDASVFDPALFGDVGTAPETHPAPDPAPSNEEDNDMPWIAKPTTPGTYLLIIPGVGVTVLADGESVSALQTMGAKYAKLSDGDFNRLKALAK